MSVASKNLFALLGNDDGDETPSGPVKTVDKNSTRTTKRNVEPQAPAKPVGATGATGGNRRGGLTGSEGAFRDRDAGSSSNQRKTTDEAYRGGGRGGRGARERGGRGGRFPRGGDDRQSRTAPGGGSEKQAAQSWGATEGEAERQDEQAGEEIAQTEQKEALAEDAQDDALAEAESKNVSYADYLAQQAEKKLALSEGLEIRKPDAKVDKKWANAKPLAKEEDDDFISGSAGKAKRERERKTKQVVDIDQRYVEPDRPTRGGPRGGGRGGGRGEGRGDFRGGPRGGGRGGEGRGRGGPRGEARGGRGGRENAAPINTQDKSAFPSLGQ